MMSKEWLTVQECIGLPGFPGSIPAVRNRLNILSAGKEGIKRKRSKSKAWEYHISILPVYVHPYVVDGDTASVRNESSAWEAEPKEIWDMMFRLPDARTAATGDLSVWDQRYRCRLAFTF